MSVLSGYQPMSPNQSYGPLDYLYAMMGMTPASGSAGLGGGSLVPPPSINGMLPAGGGGAAQPVDSSSVNNAGLAYNAAAGMAPPGSVPQGTSDYASYIAQAMQAAGAGQFPGQTAAPPGSVPQGAATGAPPGSPAPAADNQGAIAPPAIDQTGGTSSSNPPIAIGTPQQPWNAGAATGTGAGADSGAFPINGPSQSLTNAINSLGNGSSGGGSPGGGTAGGAGPSPASYYASGGTDANYNPNLFNQIAAANATPMGYNGAIPVGMGPPLSSGGVGGGVGSVGGSSGGFGAGAPSFPTSMPGAGGASSGFNPPPPPNFGSGTGGGLAFGGPGTAQMPGTLPGGSSGSGTSGGGLASASFNPTTGTWTTNDPETAAALQAKGIPVTLTGSGSGSGSSSGSGSNSGLTQALGSSTQTALNDANTANLALLQSVLGGYGSLQNELTGTLGQTTGQQFTDLANNARQLMASQDQSLMSRGLSNSTIQDSVNTGVQSAYQQALNTLEDSRLQQLLGIQSGIGQGALNTLASVNATPPDPNQLATLTQGIGASGANPSLSGPGGSGTVSSGTTSGSTGTSDNSFGSLLAQYLAGGTGIGTPSTSSLGSFLGPSAATPTVNAQGLPASDVQTGYTGYINGQFYQNGMPISQLQQVTG